MQIKQNKQRNLITACNVKQCLNIGKQFFSSPSLSTFSIMSNSCIANYLAWLVKISLASYFDCSFCVRFLSNAIQCEALRYSDYSWAVCNFFVFVIYSQCKIVHNLRSLFSVWECWCVFSIHFSLPSNTQKIHGRWQTENCTTENQRGQRTKWDGEMRGQRTEKHF